jgi:N,N'-diacetyllegionaminate synthase
MIKNKNNALIIAEFGSVHDGSFGNACKLIEAASINGANVVKFQTHLPESETLRNAPSPIYFKGEPRFDYFKRTGFTKKQWVELKNVCDHNGVKFLSSPFSIEAVELLEEIGVDIYKIPSGEVTNTPMLDLISKSDKTVILSSGMSNYKELDLAYEILNKSKELIIMQCTSEYPCPPERIGLNVLDIIKNRYNVTIGFSDHSMGYAASFAAAAKGCYVIEKHFTFSRLMYGSDASISMEPHEFKIFSSGLNEIWTMLENPIDKDDISRYAEMKVVFQKSIVSSTSMKKGHKISYNDLAFKKPGDGISASEWENIIGKIVNKNIEKDHKFNQKDFL